MKKFSSITKANSHQTSRKDRLKTIGVLGVVALLLLFFVPHVLGSFAAFVFTPVASLETWMLNSGSVLPSYFEDRSKLISENNELKKRLSSESGTMGVIERLQRENMEFRALLGESQSPRIAAGVIGRPTVTPYDVLVLDKGSDDGIVADTPVYIGFDQVIGFVSKVFSDSSVVILTTTPGFESTVYIFGPNIYTTAVGLGGGVLQVSVPQGIVLSPNDLVVIPSFEAGIYGRIGFVNSIPTEPEQHGYVTLDVSLQSIRVVSVGTSPLSPISFEEALSVVEHVRTDLTKVPVPSGVLVDVGQTASSSASTTIENSNSTQMNTE